MSDVHDRFMEHIATFNARISALTAENSKLTEALRSESQLACDLRASEDQIIERCAKALDERWPDAARLLRSHCDGDEVAVNGEDYGAMRRECAALTAELSRFQTFPCGHVAADDIKWDGCPICAMKAGAAERISALEARNEELEIVDSGLEADKLGLEAENARLREALEQVEWSGFVLDDEGCVISYLCPLCDQVKEKGHSPYCLVGIALDAARGRQG